MRQKRFFLMLILLILLSCEREKKPPTTTILLPPAPKLTPEEEAKKMLPRWMKGLQNRDPKIRQEMIQRIWAAKGWQEETAKKTLLLHLLLEENETVWNFLRSKIWEESPEEVIQVCLERLRDPRVLFRQTSFKLLSSWNEPRWRHQLEKVAQDSKEVARGYAILLLGLPIQDPQYVEVLKKIALQNNYIEPPLAIDLLVSLVQSDASIHAFLKQLLVEHVSAPVRLYCLRKLSAILPLEELLVAMNDPEGNVRLELIQQMLLKPSEKTGTWLFEASQNIENRPDIRQRALEGLFKVEAPERFEACQLMLVQQNQELHEIGLKLLIEQNQEEICWLAEGLLSSAPGEILMSLESPKLAQFPELRIFVEPHLKSEDYELRASSEALIKRWRDFENLPSLGETPQQTFELFQRAMLRFCLAFAFSCFSLEYQEKSPSISQTRNTLQNGVFRTQHKNLIQQLVLLETTITGETALGKLNRGEIQFIREKGQWKIHRIQLR